MTQQAEVSRSSQSPHQGHEIHLLRLRWFLTIFLSVWTLAEITIPVVVFCITGSPISFSLFSMLAPPIYLWYRFAKYIFMDERIFELEKMKIQRKTRNIKISR